MTGFSDGARIGGSVGGGSMLGSRSTSPRCGSSGGTIGCSGDFGSPGIGPCGFTGSWAYGVNIMSPGKPISNIHATPPRRVLPACWVPTIATVLLVIGGVACDRAETRSAPVTTSSPAGTATAPSSASAASRDEALVRVVHAIPNAAAMDVFAGDLVVFDAVSFKSVTSYRALDGKRYMFALRPAGMTNAKPLSSNTEALEDGKYYSVFALPGEGRSVHLRIVGDKLDQPSQGKVRLRLVHGGNGVGSVDVHASGVTAALFENV